MPARAAKQEPKVIETKRYTAERNFELEQADGEERDRISEIQRVRMLAAMAEVCADHGCANVTVAHVVTRAGVSRRTFYEVFADIEDCLLRTLDEALARASRRVLDAYDPKAKWVDRIRAALAALLAFLDEERFMGRLLVVESLAGGPPALERRQRMTASLVAAVDAGRIEAKAVNPPPLAAEGVVGGVLGVLHSRLSEPEPGRLIELTGSLKAMNVLPYLGAAAARSELARPVPKELPAGKAGRGSPLKHLHMRLTYRTVRVLMALAANPGSSNRQVVDASGVSDQGQMSKLLARLEQLGLIDNTTKEAPARGEPNAWTLTSEGWAVQAALAQQASR
jgi:AcrR family transcriptional regulator/DNA-binding MarR family transcriptional regulator